jgi:hypothetical protein
MVHTKWKDFLNRKVVADAFNLPSIYEVLEDDGDSITASLDLRSYQDQADPDDPEAYWQVQILLYVDLDGDRRISKISEGADLYASQISGLGNMRPADLWREEDYQSAYEFLTDLTRAS